MIRKIVILVLLLLVLGFYFFPTDTKDIVDDAAHVVKKTAKKTVDDIKSSEKDQDKMDDVKKDISNRIDPDEEENSSKIYIKK